jgi:hypothetical protein
MGRAVKRHATRKSAVFAELTEGMAAPGALCAVQSMEKKGPGIAHSGVVLDATCGIRWLVPRSSSFEFGVDQAEFGHERT